MPKQLSDKLWDEMEDVIKRSNDMSNPEGAKLIEKYNPLLQRYLEAKQQEREAIQQTTNDAVNDVIN